jgi:hypothetical protein
MKKVIIILAAVLVGATSFAQMSEKFVKAMETRIASMETAATADQWKELGNAFERIADAEKTQWLAYYYAAFTNIMAGYLSMKPGDFGDNSATLDPYADKAETMIKKAEELSKDNSEIWCIKKMIATLRLSANPMARYMTEGPISEEAIQKAKQLNPNNPRVYMLMGQDKFYTPEQFGGSKTEAKALFEEAIKLFGTFKPESNIHPNWGKPQTEQLLAQTK